MADSRATSVLGAIFAPLTLTARAARDLDAVGSAARGLAAFEDVVVAQLGGVRTDLSELKLAIRRLEDRLDRLDGQLGAVHVDVAELHRSVERVREQAEEALPDPESRGPLARARDAISGE
jgi:hypothetical protein